MFPIRNRLRKRAKTTLIERQRIRENLVQQGNHMSYDEIARATETLSYRDKFRLAQLLIQIARKEEEDQYPTERKAMSAGDKEIIEYVSERLLKSKPSKKPALSNFISTLFQFQGGISEEDKNHIINVLQKKKILSTTENGKVTYPD